MQVTDSRDLCGRDLRDVSFEEITHAFSEYCRYVV